MLSIFSSGNADAPGNVRALKAAAGVEFSGKILIIGKFSPAQIVTQASVEALDVAIYPGTARAVQAGLGSNRCDPLRYGLGNKLRPLVGMDVLRRGAF
jgi:hypothetical protein